MENPQSKPQLPCTQLKGVGPRMAERLAKCGIETVQDILFHLPFRYQDRTRITPIIRLRAGDHAVIDGVIESAEVTYGKRRSLMCHMRDASGALRLRFFHFNQSQQSYLKEGTRLRCFGEVRLDFSGKLMIHPEYQVIHEDNVAPVEETLTPIYSTTAGVQQPLLRRLTEQALQLSQQQALLNDYLPQELLAQHNWLSLEAAVQFVHRPPPDVVTQLLEDGEHPAQQRLAFEELLAHHLCLRRLREDVNKHQAPVFAQDQTLSTAFLKQLPFQLTNAQQRVSAEINTDLTTSTPMMRLVQGDVGSGKTVIAALAALQAIAAGYQVALMAPTEILAKQHYQNFTKWFEALDLNVAWLSGKSKGKTRQETLAQLADHSAQMIVGTHALFQKDVHYARLGLIIIDEQHRFGVAQRYALQEKGDTSAWPHQLIMSATPIPRTLAMTVYADLDISTIDELPPGRTPVKTVALPNTRRDEIIERIKSACREKRQAYWVCTLIEESEVMQCQAAEKTAESLSQLLSEFKVGLIHGRLKDKEKQAVMQQFKQGEIDLLVATTVIEVGVDVPNASLMVIENPERLGLAQLHQLRGRVGRGSQESFCVLLYQTPLAQPSRERLNVMRESQDGFVIARKDLELRGPGEVLGTRQTGLVNMRIADMIRDQAMIPDVQRAATAILEQHPDIIDPLIRRWVAQGESYGSV